MEAGWLNRELEAAKQEVYGWPNWLRREAGIEPKPPLSDLHDSISARPDPGTSTPLASVDLHEHPKDKSS